MIPDVCTLGKVIGGGFPLAAIAGRADIMAHFDKSAVGEDKWLMQLGTLSGNPVAAMAGLKTLEILRRDGQYERLRQFGQRIMDIVSDELSSRGIAHQVVGDQALFDVLFTDKPVGDYRDGFHADAERANHFNRILRQSGIFKATAKTYPSLALTEEDFEWTGKAVRAAAAAIAT